MMQTSAWSARTPSDWERRLYYVLPCLYAALVLAVVPVARVEGAHNPTIALVTGAAVLLADLCTALLLASEYRRSGRPALVYLTAGFFYSALMAVLHVLTFPDAIVPGTVMGNGQTVGWLFPFWRAGTLMLLLAGIARERFTTAIVDTRQRERMLFAALAAVTFVSLLLGVLFSAFEWPSMAGHSFGAINMALSWLNVVLALVCVAIIWSRRAFHDALYLWLALALVAWAAELALSNLSGARYSVGWYVSRASWVVSNCMLLVLWLAHESRQAVPGRWRLVAAYGASLCMLAAALVLQWFLLPWLGGHVPFATTFAAIAIAVWLGGWGPALCNAVAGYVLVNIWFMDPIGTFVVSTISHVLALALYGLTSAAIIGLGQAMRRARDRHRSSEQSLMRSTAALREADTNKRNFLAVLSHELRNPMAPLRNALTLLGARPDAQTVERVLPIMDRQLGHLSRLVDDLLDVSRIDRGKLELKNERVAMDAVLKASIETAKPNIEARSHELVVRFPADPVYVQGDMVRLTQAVANLVNNAAKFTPPRGHIELTLRTDGDRAVVEVVDSGIGIRAEELPKVFEMFVQLDGSRAIAAGGLGLGLPLSRSIAEIHGGTLSVRSEGPGQGSAFELRLPLAPAVAEHELPSVHSPGKTGGRRILVVDDNRDAATTLAEVLRLHGHDVRLAFDGAEGLRQAREFLPQVAFLDLNMPGMDGIALAQAIRADVRTRAMTLVALSGLGRSSDLERTRAAGFDAHLTKPATGEVIERLAAGEGGVLLHLTSAHPPRSHLR